MVGTNLRHDLRILSGPLTAGRQVWLSRLLSLSCLLLFPGGGWAQVELNAANYPHLGYYSSFSALADGDFDRALDGFQAAARSGFRSINGPWIDSICYRTMVGESHYRLGNLKLAMENYNAALNLFMSYSDWMQRVDFPVSIRPMNRQIRPPVTWAAGTRPAKFGEIPNKFPILLGRLDNSDVIQRGGVVSIPEIHAVNVHEIVRCTTLALRRRWELLGPVNKHDPLTTRLVAAFSSRLGPANHWTQAWVDVQRGYALAAAGKNTEAAAALTSAVVMSGQFDHPLTATALFGLGQFARLEGKPVVAGKLFIDASVAAAVFDQPWLVEEALAAASDTHLAAGGEAPLPQLAAAATWARQARYRHARAALSTLGAESLATLASPVPAAALLTTARQSLDRRDSLEVRMLARHEFVAAHVYYQQAKLKAAEASLAKALAMQQRVSPWLYQIGTVDRLYRSRRGALSARAANELFTELLREPTPEDWSYQPLETMGFIMAANQMPYEQWFEIALERGESQRALEISDRMRRRKFYSHLPLGGRLLSLRWLLAGPESTLPEEAIDRRNDILARYPLFKELADKSDELRDRLRMFPPAEPDDEQHQEQKDLATELDQVAWQQEAILGAIALRREYCPFLFPPLRTTAEMQASLGPKQLALVYVATSRGLYAFMLSADKYASWEVARPSSLRTGFAKLFQAYGLTGDTTRVRADQLANAAKDELGEKVMQVLFDRAQFGFWKSYDEITIVPDGLLWYMPFEALPVKQGDTTTPLISQIRVRYLPTASLMAYEPPRVPKDPRTVVVLGKLFPRDDAELAGEQLAGMQEVIEGLTPLPKRLPGDSGVLRATWDRMLVLDDIPDALEAPLGWSPGRIDEGRPGSLVTRWLALPWGGPTQLLLPGFHTATESGLKRRRGSGDEIFLSTTGLMATGAQTLLLSRWRTGGLTCYDLIREFLQEEPNVTPSEAWQRSLHVFHESEIDPTWEPRLSPSKDPKPISADHPFFWAGYMLLDVAGNRTDEVEAAEQEMPAEPAVQAAAKS